MSLLRRIESARPGADGALPVPPGQPSGVQTQVPGGPQGPTPPIPPTGTFHSPVLLPIR